MKKLEKRNLYWKLYINQTDSISEYYNTLVETNDMQYDYRDHMTTQPINCDKELERLTHADYKMCCCLLTMLIREDHFCEGAFERRVASGQIRMVLEKILLFLVQDITINEFIDLLYHYNVQSLNVYNPYKNTAARENLRCYLKYLKQKRVDIVLVGEAPGYLGCKLTGIPFTDEEQLKNLENQFALGNWVNNERIGNTSEKTAFFVWKTLRQRKNIIPLLWNIFPFHPYKEGNSESNRMPTNNEMKIGEFLLKCLIIIFDISDDQIYAVGRKAQSQLNLTDEKYIRHPSFGGNFEFEKKYLSILKEMKNIQN